MNNLFVQPDISFDTDACNQSYSGRITNGVIKSFNYPFDYINNLSCTYKFYFSDAQYTTSKKICFKTRRFDLERSIAYCTFDYLQIEDNKYCGRGLWQKGLYDPKQPTSSLWVNNLCWSLNYVETFELKFVSDSSVVGAGFYFEYSIINNTTDFSHQYPDSKIDK
ncbi:hypothetical protein HELRODRAFT_161301 [Helobdella robusta]|uniref:CUB domain-containing protein n=1 Tax=Helobdella robusta TaxID=6412 RepID=T1ERB4_HELRO|nr:hypothetical protein HELRODRAFT_161301 [Helobdella robusta]ESO02074.1 hypothetical protein HELRODRAFT_161301 [Helobdella robusta]